MHVQFGEGEYVLYFDGVEKLFDDRLAIFELYKNGEYAGRYRAANNEVALEVTKGWFFEGVCAAE